MFSFVVQAVLNPEGLTAVKDTDGVKYFMGKSAIVAERVPELLRWLSLAYLLLTNLANLLISEPKDFKQKLKE